MSVLHSTPKMWKAPYSIRANLNRSLKPSTVTHCVKQQPTPSTANFAAVFPMKTLQPWSLTYGKQSGSASLRRNVKHENHRLSVHWDFVGEVCNPNSSVGGICNPDFLRCLDFQKTLNATDTSYIIYRNLISCYMETSNAEAQTCHWTPYE